MLKNILARLRARAEVNFEIKTDSSSWAFVSFKFLTSPLTRFLVPRTWENEMARYKPNQPEDYREAQMSGPSYSWNSDYSPETDRRLYRQGGNSEQSSQSGRTFQDEAHQPQPPPANPFENNWVPSRGRPKSDNYDPWASNVHPQRREQMMEELSDRRWVFWNWPLGKFALTEQIQCPPDSTKGNAK